MTVAAESWRDTNIEHLQVSDMGNVRIATGEELRHLRPADNGRGYQRLNIKRSGRQRTVYVHRLVALAFIPNPKELLEVNHIDGNKSNNRSSNLEWVTRIENVRHAINTGLIDLRRTPCAQLSRSGELINTYSSYVEAALDNDCFMGGIRNVCKGIRPSYKGYVWRDLA